MNSPDHKWYESKDLSWRHMAAKWHSVIDFPFSEPIPHMPFQTRLSSPGIFRRLPLELQQQVLLNCDLSSLANTRLSNYYFKSIIDRLLQFRDVVQHASMTLRNLKATETDRYCSLDTLYEELTRQDCFWCGDYGPFLFMLKCRRACFNCLYRNPKLRIMSHVLEFFGLDTHEVRHLPSLHALKGSYSRQEVELIDRFRLYMTSEVEKIALEKYGDKEMIYCAIQRRWENCLKEAKSRQELKYDPPNPMYAHEPSRNPNFRPEGVYRNQNPLDSFRCVGATPFPSISVKRDNSDSYRQDGLWCRGCCNAHDYETWGNSPTIPRSASLELALERRMFKAWSNEGFLQHVRACEDAKRIWEINEASKLRSLQY